VKSGFDFIGGSVLTEGLGGGAGQLEKRNRLGQLAKKIGISQGRRFLPSLGNCLFHSELGGGAGQ